ncbi:SA1362 family protein [Sinobaca sp. H24]|uniref:SA1362 family protein n=1 Tax=Sinobaca sp. H24 TaxID=2923376 RepID=UPI00207A63D7|nr:SA1362 family protein [Sinobaca sp. H24]
MSRILRRPFLLLLFGLAAFGLGNQLLTNPISFLISLAIGLAIAVGLYFLFTKVIMKKMTQRQYQSHAPPRSKAANARRGGSAAPAKSHYKSAGSQPKPVKKRSTKAIARKRSDTHLTVIEGKKTEKRTGLFSKARLFLYIIVYYDSLFD